MLLVWPWPKELRETSFGCISVPVTHLLTAGFFVSVYLFVHPSVNPIISPSIHPPTHPSIHPLIHPFSQPSFLTVCFNQTDIHVINNRVRYTYMFRVGLTRIEIISV
jgi:hypothetical protein